MILNHKVKLLYQKLKFEKGRINADLKVNGVVNIDTLTKNNIKLDGATVEAAEKANDNTVKLTIAADGIKSVNDFADLIGGKAMKLGDYEFAAAVSQASFYPVFDYVEADGDNLKLTLKLYANSGTFDKNIKAEAISFADDFKDSVDAIIDGGDAKLGLSSTIVKVENEEIEILREGKVTKEEILEKIKSL